MEKSKKIIWLKEVQPKTRKRKAERRKKNEKSGKLFFNFRRFSQNSVFFTYLKL